MKNIRLDKRAPHSSLVFHCLSAVYGSIKRPPSHLRIAIVVAVVVGGVVVVVVVVGCGRVVVVVVAAAAAAAAAFLPLLSVSSG